MTTREKLVVYLKECQENGRPPTIMEMAEAIGVSSPNTVSYHLNILERDGIIQRKGGARDVELIEKEEVAA